MKRHLEMGLEDQAAQFCQGILLGLYRVRDGGENDILNWVPDFPGEAAANALKVWSETGGAKRGAALAKKRRRRLSPDFVRGHLPDWVWLFKPRARGCWARIGTTSSEALADTRSIPNPSEPPWSPSTRASADGVAVHGR